MKSKKADTNSSKNPEPSPSPEGSELWEPMPGETAMAYAAFKAYRDTNGTERTLPEVGRRIGKSRAQVEKWSGRWRWAERAKAWDAHLEAKLEAARDEAMKKEAESWAQRQIKIRSSDFELAEKLRAKVSEMLDYPLSKKIVKDNGKTIHIHPARWSIESAARMLQTASNLQRLAAGMATDKTEISGPDNQPVATGQVVILELPDNRRGGKKGEG